MAKEFFLENVAKQTFTKVCDGIEIRHEETFKMTVSDFEAAAKQSAVDLPLDKTDDWENAFWNSTFTSQSKLYAVENIGTLFADDFDLWNFSKFTQTDSFIHEKVIELFFIHTIPSRILLIL